MKMTLPCALMLTFGLVFGLQSGINAAEGKPALEQQQSKDKVILDIAHSMMEAYKKKDIAHITATLSDDFIGTYDGDVWDKKTLLDALKSGDDVVESLVNSDVKIRHFPGTAIMTGQVDAKEIYKGKDISGKHRFTIVFVQIDQKWRVASEHWSSIPEEEKEAK